MDEPFASIRNAWDSALIRAGCLPFLMENGYDFINKDSLEE